MLIAVLLPVASGIRTPYLHFEDAILEDTLNTMPVFLFSETPTHIVCFMNQNTNLYYKYFLFMANLT